MFVIGIDPHEGSHSAAVLDQDEQLVGELRVRAGRRQREELVAFASRFEPRCWAIEGATGTGALLAQRLVAVGETVLDVPPTLSARAFVPSGDGEVCIRDRGWDALVVVVVVVVVVVAGDGGRLVAV